MSESDATLVERFRADLNDDLETLRERPLWMTARNVLETPVMFAVHVRAFAHAWAWDLGREQTPYMDDDVTFHLTPRYAVRGAAFQTELVGRAVAFGIAVALWMTYGGGGTAVVATGGASGAEVVNTGFQAPPVIRELAAANWLVLALDPFLIVTRWFK